MTTTTVSGAVLDDGSSTESDFFYGEDEDDNLVPISTDAKSLEGFKALFPTSSVTDGAKLSHRVRRFASEAELSIPASSTISDHQPSSREEGEVTCDEQASTSASAAVCTRPGLASVATSSSDLRGVVPSSSSLALPLSLRLNTPSPRGLSSPITSWSPSAGDNERRRSAHAKAWQASDLSRDLSRRDAPQRPARQDAAMRSDSSQLSSAVGRHEFERRSSDLRDVRDKPCEPKSRRNHRQQASLTDVRRKDPRDLQRESGRCTDARRGEDGGHQQQCQSAGPGSGDASTRSQTSMSRRAGRRDQAVGSEPKNGSSPQQHASERLERGYVRPLPPVVKRTSSWRDASRDPRQRPAVMAPIRSPALRQDGKKRQPSVARASRPAKAQSGTQLDSALSSSMLASCTGEKKSAARTADTHNRRNEVSRKRPHPGPSESSSSRVDGVDDGFVADVRHLKLKVLFIEQELEAPSISDHARAYFLDAQKALRAAEAKVSHRNPTKFPAVYKSVRITQDEISHYRKTRGFGNRVESYLKAQASLDRHKEARNWSKAVIGKKQARLNEIHAELLAENRTMFVRVLKEFHAANQNPKRPSVGTATQDSRKRQAV